MENNFSKLSLKKGVEEANDQRRPIFGVVDELQDALNDHMEEGEINSRFQRLRRYVHDHVRFEKALMREYDILDYQGRQTDHASVVENLRAFRDGYLGATDPELKQAIPSHVVFFLREWLNKHSDRVDQQYAQFKEANQQAG